MILRQSNVIYPDGYLEQMRLRGIDIGRGELLKLGFPADAATLYSESLTVASQIPADSSNYIGNRHGLVASTARR